LKFKPHRRRTFARQGRSFIVGLVGRQHACDKLILGGQGSVKIVWQGLRG